MFRQIPVTILTRSSHAASAQLFRRVLNQPYGHHLAFVLQDAATTPATDSTDSLIVETATDRIIRHRACDLAAILEGLMRQRTHGRIRFERLVIEAWHTDPGPVADVLFEHAEIGQAYMLDQIVALVDGAGFAAMLDDDAAMSHLALADLVIVSGNADGGPADTSAAAHHLRELNRAVRVMDVRDEAVALQTIFPAEISRQARVW